ncbi:MAG: hypothetical protein MUF27_01630 [Acidobacteria bacterium]|nr:hypothetical protein [Acidobacteriota bacterium]
MPDSLGPLTASRKSGAEAFHLDGETLAFDVLDFWRWSGSDLLENTRRGILAEYIVARALGISTDSVRAGWSAYDLETPDGIRIEVKSAAYLQSWAQQRLSTIQFAIAERRGWSAETNLLEGTPRRHADVYVFALLAHQIKEAVDPMNLAQWRFWAVPTPLLDERARSQHSITIPSLRALAGEGCGFAEIRAAVCRCVGGR